MAFTTSSNFAGKAAGFYIAPKFKRSEKFRLLNYDREYQI